MDATPVTNQQFVVFLNQVLPKIEVKDGVVHSDGRIWLYLGQVKPGYEPIIYDGRFHIRIAEHAACPVLRVTGYGAAAYARFYGERLPTGGEWFYAVKTGLPKGPGQAAWLKSQKELPIPSPVMVYKANSFGIRGLNANIGEWGIEDKDDELSSKKAKHAKPETYVVLGGLHENTDQERPSIVGPITRFPWEAFERVGFQCVRNINGKSE